jgi:hypothetical protein
MKTALTLITMTLGAASHLLAVENASASGFEPPKKYGAERYMAGWERNPFAVPTPPAPPAAVESEFKDLAIKSIYGPKDNPIFSLVNTKTHERMRITMEKPTKDGVELKSFSLAENRRETTIEVAKGTETATLKYATDYVPPAANGAPGARPGMPGMPGAPGMPGGANRIPIPQLGAANPAANRNLPGQPAAPANRGDLGSQVVIGAPGANAAADATARRRIIPSVAGTANPAAGVPAVNVGVGKNGSPTVTLGHTGSNTPAPQPQNTGAPGEISPPIVRPPPSIYLDGSQQQ